MFPSLTAAPSLELLAKRLPAYRFELLIAQGEKGAVYKARQLSLDRDVAIRILPRELGADPAFRESFESKAKALARLSHPNLIKVYDYGDADGLLFTVMEYVHGKSLFRSANGIKVDPHQAIDIVTASLRGLEHAHENCVHHLNIKPANILLNEKREPKIGSFGLSSHSRDSLSYSAPEATHDQADKDQSSDVYSAGVVLKEMLTGFPANTTAFEYAEISDPSLARICAVAMSVDPAARHANLDRLCQSLSDWSLPEPAPIPREVTINAMPLPRRTLASTQASRVNWPMLGNSAVIAFLLATISFTWNL